MRIGNIKIESEVRIISESSPWRIHAECCFASPEGTRNTGIKASLGRIRNIYWHVILAGRVPLYHQVQKCHYRYLFLQLTKCVCLQIIKM